MDNQLKIIEAARKKGWDPSKLSTSQYRSLALSIRSTKEKIHDGAKAVGSLLQTSANIGVVTDEEAAANEAVCKVCPSGQYREIPVRSREKMADGTIRLVVIKTEPGCDACNCTARFLRSKWKNKNQACPKLHWDNRKAPDGQ